MADLSILIDTDAYRRLTNAQRPGESLSDTLRRMIWDPVPFQAALKQLAADPLSDEAVAAVEQVVSARNQP